MLVGMSVYGIRRGGVGAECTMLKRASGLMRKKPGLAHHAMWQAQEQAGHAEDEVNVCISEVHIPLHVEHITLHHELGLCMGMGNPWVLLHGSHGYRCGVRFANPWKHCNHLWVTRRFQPPVPHANVGSVSALCHLSNNSTVSNLPSPAPVISHHLLPCAISHPELSHLCRLEMALTHAVSMPHHLEPTLPRGLS